MLRGCDCADAMGPSPEPGSRSVAQDEDGGQGRCAGDLDGQLADSGPGTSARLNPAGRLAARPAPPGAGGSAVLLPGVVGGLSTDITPTAAWRAAWNRTFARQRAGTGPTSLGTTPLGTGLGTGSPIRVPPSKQVGAWYPHNPGQAGFWSFKYRTVGFNLPIDWLLAYHADLGKIRLNPELAADGTGLVSGQRDTLDAVWPRFMAARSATGVDAATIRSGQGCWALPKGESNDDYWFWNNGWGAPHQFYLNTAWMLMAYYGWIKDSTEFGGGLCRGLGRYVRDTFADEDPLNTRGRACRPVINFVGTSGSGTAASNCRPKDSKECGRYHDSGNRGIDWDDWTAVFRGDDSRQRSYWAFADGEDWADLPPDGASTAAFAGITPAFVNLHAAHLAGYGFMADWIMYLSRMAFDYWRSGEGSRAYYGVAWQLARYPLAMMANLGRLLIHEIGHIYMGDDGHCPYGCCFEVAGQKWRCEVLGQLGLPWEPFHPAAAGIDFPNTWTVAYGNIASGGTDGGSRLQQRCRVEFDCGSTPGVDNVESDFCVTETRCESTVDDAFGPGTDLVWGQTTFAQGECP